MQENLFPTSEITAGYLAAGSLEGARLFDISSLAPEDISNKQN